MAIETDKLVKTYIQMRDKISAIEAEAKENKKDIKDKMDIIEKELFKRLKDEGLESFKTDAGTVFKTTTDYVGVDDFDELLKFIAKSVIRSAFTSDENASLEAVEATLEEAANLALEHADFQFLNKAVNKTATKEYMEANNGALPPGIKYGSEIVIQIRKK